MVDALTADVLPDSRSIGARGGRPGPGGFWIPIYCASCGEGGGSVPEANMNFVFWLCNDCFVKHGEIANTMVMPDEVYWERLRQEQMDKYKRLLEEQELLAIVAADASPLASLIKQGSDSRRL